MNIMKRALPWSEQVDVISSDESSSSSSSSSYSSFDVEVQVNDGTKNVAVDQPPKELSSYGNFVKWVQFLLHLLNL